MAHPDQLFGDKTYAQHGDDLVIRAIFHSLGIATPSYLDVGAHHPERISNTKLFYDNSSLFFGTNKIGWGCIIISFEFV